MMWPILKIYIGLALIVAIHAQYGHEEYINAIRSHGLVDEIFRPIHVLRITVGGNCNIYSAQNMVDHRMVALKISRNIDAGKYEYAMYTYLNAINNSNVERYGILPIYYFHIRENSTVTAFPLFKYDESLAERHYSKRKLESIDCLILFRDFVRQSKYIHSRGIRHDNIKPGHFSLTKSRSFLIDFHVSSKMNEIGFGGTSLLFASRRYHNLLPRINALAENETWPQNVPVTENEMRRPIDDWESFLYTMAYVLDVKLEWFKEREHLDYADDREKEKVKPSKENTAKTMKQIANKIECVHLKEVMVALADETLIKTVRYPNYTFFEQLINEKFEALRKPVYFTWLKDNQERYEAIQELRNNPLATVYDIEDPKATFDYDPPNYEYFDGRRPEMVEIAKQNHERYLNDKL